MENNQLTDYQRIENVKNYLKIPSWRQFASIIGVNGGQIFTNIKQKKNTISAKIAHKICQAFPQISFEYLMEGNGDMLRPTIGDGAIVQQAIAGRDINGNVEQNTTSADISTLIAANAELTKQNGELIAIIKGQNQQLTQLINIQIKQQ